MTDLPFTYSDAEWQAIVAELPSVSAAHFDELEAYFEREADEDSDLVEMDDDYRRHDSPHVRRDLEELAGLFISGYYTPDNTQFERHQHLGPILSHATALASHLNRYWETTSTSSASDLFEPSPLWHEQASEQKRFLSDLQGFVDFLNKEAAHSPKNMADGRRRHWARNNWVFSVLMVWAYRGGKWGVSTDTLTNKAGGPTVRFLRAVVEPVYRTKGEQAPTDGALADIVYKIRHTLGNTQGENF
jgi:hypothetical protein